MTVRYRLAACWLCGMAFSLHHGGDRRRGEGAPYFQRSCVSACGTPWTCGEHHGAAAALNMALTIINHEIIFKTAQKLEDIAALPLFAALLRRDRRAAARHRGTAPGPQCW